MRDSMTHPLLKAPDTLSLGQEMPLEKVCDEYLMDELAKNERRATTVRDICRHVERFALWWSGVTDEPLPVARIDRRHLVAFRSWLLSGECSPCGANRHIATIRQVLRCAERNGLIEHSPSLEALPHRSVAPKVYLDDEQVTRLWRAAAKLNWPRRTDDLKQLPYSPAEAWRCALVFWRTYGFRTQELIRLERKFRSITWGNIHPAGITPNGEGHCRCEHGWLSYVPQKQERVKPESLTNPLTSHGVAALRVLGRAGRTEDKQVFDWAMSSTSFRATWKEWMRMADVHPRRSSGVNKFTPKHFRKTATTFLNLHRPGMAQWIVGHGSDRSGQNSVISSKHYDNAEQGVLETLETFPQPACFDELFGEISANAA